MGRNVWSCDIPYSLDILHLVRSHRHDSVPAKDCKISGFSLIWSVTRLRMDRAGRWSCTWVRYGRGADGAG